MLKGHPPGCFHSISGQNAGLVSHLEWQEWGIFTFINPYANTLVDMDLDEDKHHMAGHLQAY